jgi:hypothetical protein
MAGEKFLEFILCSLVDFLAEINAPYSGTKGVGKWFYIDGDRHR